MSVFEPALEQLSSGDSLFLPGASAEVTDFTRVLAKRSNELPRLNIVNSFVPGLNRTTLAAEGNSLSETVFFPRGSETMISNQVRYLPISYYGCVRHLQNNPTDWVVLHLSAPDANGYCSLGTSAEFLPVVLNGQAKAIGIINPRMPYIANGHKIALSELTVSIEHESDLVAYDVGGIDETSERIADNISDLIESGDVIQAGLGKVPDKLISSLGNLRQLCFHSGMISDGFIRLAEAGALDMDFTHLTCCALGSQDFYQQLPDIESLRIAGVEETHAPEALAKYDSFVAINSALEIDLWGQANLEMLGTRQISSIGGAPDFARAARNARRGKSIIALPATAAKGKVSRIVPTLKPGQVTSIGRNDIDYVVTEFGMAQLQGKSIRERAEALIGIAAPQFRDQLDNDWQTQLSHI